jgi:phosphoribosylaminoimidazole-succinocarboxamide synthase
MHKGEASKYPTILRGKQKRFYFIFDADNMITVQKNQTILFNLFLKNPQSTSKPSAKS